MISPASAALEHLRAAIAEIEEAATHLTESDRDGAALLAQRCDWLSTEVQALASALKVRNP